MVVEYVSIWDGDEITTSANYDPVTKDVTDIETVDIDEDYNCCEREFIRLSDGTEIEETEFLIEGETYEERKG